MTRRDIYEIPRELIPDGFVYQWITKSILGDETESLTRYLLHLQNGWRPVPADRHRDLYPKAVDVIEIGGLVLAELSQDLWEQRDREAKQRVKDQRKGYQIAQGFTTVFLSRTFTADPYPGYWDGIRSRSAGGVSGRFHKVAHWLYLAMFRMTEGEYNAACEGTLVYNTGPLAGRALGPREYRRRRRIMRKQGRYKYGV